MTDIVTIREVVQECYDTKTFRFDWDADAREYGIPPREIEAMADAFED